MTDHDTLRWLLARLRVDAQAQSMKFNHANKIKHGPDAKEMPPEETVSGRAERTILSLLDEITALKAPAPKGDVERVRKEALEEAAKEASKYGNGHSIAKAIRALATPPVEKGA